MPRPTLAYLDRHLAEAYAKALRFWRAESIRTEQQPLQEKWLASRNACAKTASVKACVEAITWREDEGDIWVMYVVAALR